MATLDELRQRVFENLYDNSRAQRPKLQRSADTIDDTDDELEVEDASVLSVEDIVEFFSGEQALVWEIDTDTDIVTLVRGWNGTAADAVATGDFLKINPKWTIKQVDDALSEALIDLDAQGLFEIASGTDLVLVQGQSLYELAETDVYLHKPVLSVFYERSVSGDLVGLPFQVVTDPDSQALTGTVAVRLGNWGSNSLGDTVHITYARSVRDALGTLTDPMLETAAVAYATGRLLQATEGPRIHDPGRHTDRTVQPGQGLRDGSFWMAMYQREVWRYRAALGLRIRDLPGKEWRRGRRFRRG